MSERVPSDEHIPVSVKLASASSYKASDTGATTFACAQTWRHLRRQSMGIGLCGDGTCWLSWEALRLIPGGRGPLALPASIVRP